MYVKVILKVIIKINNVHKIFLNNNICIKNTNQILNIIKYINICRLCYIEIYK